MSYGYENLTDSGALLATADAKCMHFLGVASLTSTVSTFVTQYQITSPMRPLVFARMAVNDALCIYRVTAQANSVWAIDVIGPQRATAQLLCFSALSTEPPAESYGLRLLMPDGQVAFDSTRKPLWLSELFTQYGATLTPATMAQTWARSYNLPALTVYAVAQATPGPGGGIYMLGIKRSTTGHQYVWCTVSSGTGTPTTANFCNNTVFLIESLGLT